ncbi:MAG TPA: DoxX family protein [Mucilaginibacter sp.]|nr:DoxX family protein [Mucilaginibacter sp.]
MKLTINKPPGFLIIPRLIVGLIFLSEGIQKFVNPADTGTGRFAKIGFSHPEFWANFTGSFEIVCAILILLGIAIRFAAIPLLIVMMVAFVTTKWPIAAEKGFWPLAHEYRTDLAMTLLLIMLIKYASIKNPTEN